MTSLGKSSPHDLLEWGRNWRQGVEERTEKEAGLTILCQHDHFAILWRGSRHHCSRPSGSPWTTFYMFIRIGHLDLFSHTHVWMNLRNHTCVDDLKPNMHIYIRIYTQISECFPMNWIPMFLFMNYVYWTDCVHEVGWRLDHFCTLYQGCAGSLSCCGVEGGKRKKSVGRGRVGPG